MPDFFDRNDTRPAKSRETSLFKSFKTIVAIAKPRAAGLRRLLRDCELQGVERREDLQKLPILRKDDINRLHTDNPVFGGMLATRLGALRRVVPRSPQGQTRDWWQAARALAAAGFEKHDVLLNCFSYHLASEGHIVDDAASALGCAVIPAGNASIEKKLAAIHVFKPVGYCGDAEHLKQLLDHAQSGNYDVSSLRKAFVFGAYLSPHLRAELENRDIRVRQAYVTPECGVIAYESDLSDGSRNEGMFVNEGLIVEIVKPGTSEAAAPGETGEVVVTRVNADFPVPRLSTGDLSRFIMSPSPCGRTATRIAGWLGRADEATRALGRSILPGDVLELGARHACVRRMQIAIGAEGGRETLTLRAEGPLDDRALPSNLKGNLKALFGLDGEVELVGPGVLSDHSPLIVDERR